MKFKRNGGLDVAVTPTNPCKGTVGPPATPNVCDGLPVSFFPFWFSFLLLVFPSLKGNHILSNWAYQSVTQGSLPEHHHSFSLLLLLLPATRH